MKFTKRLGSQGLKRRSDTHDRLRSRKATNRLVPSNNSSLISSCPTLDQIQLHEKSCTGDCGKLRKQSNENSKPMFFINNNPSVAREANCGILKRPQTGVYRMTRYLSAPQVQERFQISRSTLYRWQENRTVGFPPPLKIGHRILWRETDLQEFDAKLAKSQTS